METKMIAIPFDVERAKRIQAGEGPGTIMTRNGHNVRVVCWDRAGSSFHIIALIGFEEGPLIEACESYKDNGSCLESEEDNELDLILQVPEWTQYKDGDILACKLHYGTSDYCKWLSILRGEINSKSNAIQFMGYVSYNYENQNNDTGLEFDDYVDYIGSVCLATDKEKQKFADILKKSTNSRAKEYLKRFFEIEEKKEYKFEPFQKVLVRFSDDHVWEASLFSHKCDKDDPYLTVGGIEYGQCIPYCEETKHLLGTTDDLEEAE